MLLALLRQYIRPYRRLVAALMALQLISTLASLYLPTVNAAIIDDGVAKGDTNTIIRLGVVMLGVTGLQVLCAVGAVYFGARTGTGFGRDLRAAMFEHVITFSERETARFGASTLLTRSTNDVRQIVFLVQTTATVLVAAPIMSIGGIIMAVHQEAALTWLLLVSVPILALANYWIMTHMLPLFRSMQALIDGINRVLRDQLSGVRVVRAFTREPFERDRFAQANTALASTALRAGNWQALMLPVTTLTINVSSVAVIWFGGLLIDQGRMQVGSLSAFLSYFAQILMAVLMATMTLVVLPRAAVCAERITEVLSTPAALNNPQHPRFPAAGITGAVRLENITFSYPGADCPVLQDISLSAPPGATTAIVGSTGSGKSTLISLICRLYDVTGGAVLLDGIDVRDYQTERLWAAIGLVPQRGYLFSGTVADNLRYGKSDATDEEMWEALRVAAAEEFVRAHGLQMRVAQGGINFSGGQRQRLAIARAIIGRPAVYLFDDAFSALDVHTDARVRAALRELATKSTIIIVTQRVSTAAQADQVIVIDDGRVVGAGTHDSLLIDCPTYAEFAVSQSVTTDIRGVS
ncbi:putative multidrug export ATP-binding/permease protein [Mycobacterium marinum]|uniref:Putative multidrug export ATP-binding/permease protein n=1 Tax=Mycobacterium marinum TaxID=1781 RepID=A0A2Z5YJS4_MYCMR|nr:ABC transporter ATP-binding protein [Mycobacterium marinum]AXN46071.1 Putative multidrug export ATP-binding/permease protein [Mycobacterium marinum]AXN51495.1 Putative multidrug export ATP-binding/permease protein [Mycobacterium marinum]EPQ74525.1 Lipid A export ATP-binding/permease protein MsbA [Mycobacterium marinum str. Europe]RFZ01217.1 putative multidrug export ATP-binding/permease protein [Mycobacterium marinum]RFZ05008.1 putative multidrug export ATP-binding/permease protein [Mycobac